MKKLLMVTAAIAFLSTAMCVTGSVNANAASPVFGSAKVALLSKDGAKHITAKGATANSYGYTAASYAYAAYYYGYYYGSSNPYYWYVASYYAGYSSGLFSYALYLYALGY